MFIDGLNYYIRTCLIITKIITANYTDRAVLPIISSLSLTGWHHCISNKISPMAHNKLKIPIFFKHNVYCTGAVTEGQQTSDNFHRPMLHRHKT